MADRPMGQPMVSVLKRSAIHGGSPTLSVEKSSQGPNMPLNIIMETGQDDYDGPSFPGDDDDKDDEDENIDFPPEWIGDESVVVNEDHILAPVVASYRAFMNWAPPLPPDGSTIPQEMLIILAFHQAAEDEHHLRELVRYIEDLIIMLTDMKEDLADATRPITRVRMMADMHLHNHPSKANRLIFSREINTTIAQIGL